MDKISFDVITGTLEENEPLQIGVQCFINGHLVTSWDDIPIDVLEIKKSSVIAGNYCVFTCTCGIPECGGVDSAGFTIIHQSDSIVWKNLSFPFQNVDTLTFNKEQYINAVNELWRDYRRVYFELKKLNTDFEFCPDLRMSEILEEIFTL